MRTINKIFWRDCCFKHDSYFDAEINAGHLFSMLQLVQDTYYLCWNQCRTHHFDAPNGAGHIILMLKLVKRTHHFDAKISAGHITLMLQMVQAESSTGKIVLMLKTVQDTSFWCWNQCRAHHFNAGSSAGYTMLMLKSVQNIFWCWKQCRTPFWCSNWCTKHPAPLTYFEVLTYWPSPKTRVSARKAKKRVAEN